MENILSAIRANIQTVLVGEERAASLLLTALIAGGHVLIEDVPGMGKTVLARSLAKSVDAAFGRVQFTPDLLPSDVTGLNFFDRKAGDFVFSPGPVFCSILLADEINRATPRTQSALLECMAEGQVTVDGVSHPVPRPFLVIATQNPAGASGTQPLPDSQMDRFMVRLSIGYPAPADEMAMVRRRQGGALLEGVRPVLELNGLLALRAQAGQVYVSDEVLDYIVRLVGATRSHPMILQGASPRATLALTAMAKAAALVRGRDYVLPEDVCLVFGDVVPHRLLLSPRAEADRSFDPASELLERVPAPRIS